MYCVQPIFEDENPWMTNGIPPHHAIMKGGEGSLSNLKEASVKCGVFMTPTLSHQVKILYGVPH